MDRRRVLIICTGNSARSQMAEAFLRHEAGDLYEVASAGTHPAAVRSEAMAVMREVGLDISGQRSKPLAEFHSSSLISLSIRAGVPVRSGHTLPINAAASAQM